VLPPPVGERPVPTSADKARIKELEHENRELRQVNEFPKKASACFAQAGLDCSFRK
jgi:transposase